MMTMTGVALKIIGNWSKAAVLTPTLLAVALVASAASAAQTNSWTLSISEKEMKLEHPTDMMWDKWLMWDIGYQRMVCRNEPYIELANDAASTDPITEFHITIGDNRFNFGPVEGGTLALLGSTTPGFNLSSSTANQGNELVVNIAGGLQPGDAVRFMIKLNVDPSFAAQYSASFGSSLPDYRTVLFDMNGNNVYDGTHNKSTADNSQAFVVFDPAGKSSTATFEDEDVAAGQYFNNNLREYRAMDPVLIFQLEGQLIPEPSSIGLVMLGLVSGLLMRSRSRRSPVAIS